MHAFLPGGKNKRDKKSKILSTTLIDTFGEIGMNLADVFRAKVDARGEMMDSIAYFKSLHEEIMAGLTPPNRPENWQLDQS